MIIKTNNAYFSSNLENIIFTLLLFIPLSFFFGSAFLNLILAVLFFIFIFSIKRKEIFHLIFNSDFKFIFFFCFYLIINSLLNYLDLQTFLKSISYLRFPILMVIFLYLFKNISGKKKDLWANINIIFLIIISLDLLFQYFIGKNSIGFLPGMCGENYLKDKAVCTRYSGFFNDEFIMGGYLSTIFFSIILFINSIKKKWSLITIIIIFFIYILIMITGERSATLTILLTLFFIFLQYKINYRFKIISLLILSFLTILMVNLNPHVKGRFINFFDHDMKKNNHLSTFQKFATTPWGLHSQKSLRLFLDKPIIGHGLKSFRVKCDDYNLYFDRLEKKHRACSTHPHNLIMELLSEQGIIGLILFFSFFFIIFKRSFEKNGFYNEDLSLIALRSLIFVLIFIPKPVGSIFSSINATMIWFCVSLFLIKINSKTKK